MLYVVATPIGNLGDLSERARTTLRQVDLILAEDTRHSQKLLSHHAIQTPLLSLHEHNEQQRLDALIDRLQQGETLALISDAGTPLISDPGYRLVSAAHAAGIVVRVVPGPSALAAALSVAGQPTDRFVFEGYLPAKPAARRQRLTALASEMRTLVFYETPHRIGAMLADAADVMGSDRQATLCKELSKQFEQNVRGTLTELADWLLADARRGQGEFVIVIAGNTAADDSADPRPLLRSLLRHLPLKTAVTVAAEVSDEPRNRLYKIALALSREMPDDG